MRLKLTVAQFKRILERPDTEAKYPITIDLKKVPKSEVKELIALLKKKKG